MAAKVPGKQTLPERKYKNRANVRVSDTLWAQVENYHRKHGLAVVKIVELALQNFFEDAPKSNSVANMTPSELQIVIGEALRAHLSQEAMAERTRYEVASRELVTIGREIDNRWAKLSFLGKQLYDVLTSDFADKSSFSKEGLARYKALLDALADPAMQKFPGRE